MYEAFDAGGTYDIYSCRACQGASRAPTIMSQRLKLSEVARCQCRLGWGPDRAHDKDTWHLSVCKAMKGYSTYDIYSCRACQGASEAPKIASKESKLSELYVVKCAVKCLRRFYRQFLRRFVTKTVEYI